MTAASRISTILLKENKFKEAMELTVMDKKIVVTSVYNGKEAWIRSDNTDVPVTDEILAEFKEATYT